MILVLQFHPADGPATLGDWLNTRALPWRVIEMYRATDLPRTFRDIDAIAALGGPMSVNDPMPMLRSAERLLASAVERDIPVLGHCLGGQLLAHALGARVRRNPVPEIGWHRIDFEDDAVAQRCFGRTGHAHVFQWHVDTFDLPSGATRFARSEHCANQAYTIGRAIGMQFHIEIDAATLSLWRSEGADLLRAADRPTSVQDDAQIEYGTRLHLGDSRAMAAHLFERWLAPIGAAV